MNIYSVKNNAELCEKVKQYCKKNWNKVYEVFLETANLSVKSDKLPQTWVLEQDNEIMGFYQLVYNDKLTYYTDLSPFVATLFVDEGARGHRYSEIMLTHAKSETAKLGYDKLYVSTDHIGFYEKFGFKEIGLDIYTWGNPTKIYEGYTVHLSEIFQNY